MNVRQIVVVAVLMAASVCFGCDLFESPTEPEELEELMRDPTEDDTDPGDTGTGGDDLSTCFRKLTDGAGLVNCVAGGGCSVRMDFVNECSRTYAVSVRWAAYDAQQRHLGVAATGCQSGNAASYYELAASLIVDQNRSLLGCFDLHGDADSVKARWRVCPALRTNGQGGTTCFDDEAPPSTIDTGEPLLPGLSLK